MHVAFGKAMDFAGGEYGEAILSRYPLSEVQVHNLPFTEGCEPRCALAAHVRLGDDGPEFVFAGTHLEHAKAPVRLCQAQKLNPALAAKNTLPTILAGDFNDVPESPAVKILQPHWTDATAGQPQPTWPSDQPRMKIDYVFFRPADGWCVVEKQVINEAVASDHRPLLVVLEWVPSWLSMVPEMERIADLDSSLGDRRWSAADDAKHAADLGRVQAPSRSAGECWSKAMRRIAVAVAWDGWRRPAASPERGPRRRLLEALTASPDRRQGRLTTSAWNCRCSFAWTPARGRTGNTTITRRPCRRSTRASWIRTSGVGRPSPGRQLQLLRDRAQLARNWPRLSPPRLAASPVQQARVTVHGLFPTSGACPDFE
jgi:Endonuclease/Exonuclease/phosphatase family